MSSLPPFSARRLGGSNASSKARPNNANYGGGPGRGSLGNRLKQQQQQHHDETRKIRGRPVAGSSSSSFSFSSSGRNSSSGLGGVTVGSTSNSSSFFRSKRQVRDEDTATMSVDNAAILSMDGAASADDVVDLLDFGTSVNVNDDLRRAIQSETKDLEESNRETKDVLRHEGASERQLLKDLNHSKMEMKRHSQGAEGQLEAGKMHSSAVKSLGAELQSEIVELLTMNTSTTMTTTETNNNGGNNQDNETSPHPITPDNRQRGSKGDDETNDNYDEESGILSSGGARTFNRLLATLRKESKARVELITKIHDIIEKRRQLERAKEEQGLLQSLKQANEAVEQHQIELEQDERSLGTLVVAIQKHQEKCSSLTKELEDLTKELSAHKKANADDEAERANELKATAAKMEHLKKVKVERLMKIETIKRNTQECAKELEEYHDFSLKRDAITREMEEKHRRKLLLQLKLSELKTKFEDAERTKTEATKRKNIAELRLEASRLRQDVSKKFSDDQASKMTSLQQRKQEVAAKISEWRKAAEQAQLKEKQLMDDKLEEKVSLENELHQLKEKFHAKQDEALALEQQWKEYQNIQESKIEDDLSMPIKLLNVIRTEEAVMELGYRQKEKKLQGEVDLMKNRLKLYQAAAPLLEKARKAEIGAYGKL